MGNSGFVKSAPRRVKAHRFIETDRGNLCVEIDLRSAAFARPGNRAREQLRADAFTSLRLQHRHASDFRAAGTQDEPRGPHGPIRGERQKMNRLGVVAVELNFHGHPLLPDEDPGADGEGLL